VPNLDTLAGIEAAIAEEEARLAADLARLAECRAEGRDTATVEALIRVDRGRLADLREHRAWLLARWRPPRPSSRDRGTAV
jgi:hypothetical protein